jgi:cobalt-precorrin 5A hydrolase/precorrin-3B C17-methyltransferase
MPHRPEATPVVLARNLGRDGERVRVTTLRDLDAAEVDMLTVVLVGSSQSKLVERGDGVRMYTPRGYARKLDGGLADVG